MERAKGKRKFTKRACAIQNWSYFLGKKGGGVRGTYTEKEYNNISPVFAGSPNAHRRCYCRRYRRRCCLRYHRRYCLSL
ncbi:hypothetical protein POVWA2_052030 [Plasmodium ovale wallikeri]|uniref:Uncharacterized protein n=1 Tax=Plasmodium ovale wallikeri TaxID=864142 RepID=A0A1A8ZQK6_PLAOA|nr:hypothetical protein POVWA1_052760 [Plasmodium ovale wallikeri]SBT46404.1 hypothetical protein POVWA2_052030 [Plasmodium ovale wallikeri]